MNRMIAGLALLLVLATCSMASAYNVYGHFKTSGGHTVHIKAERNGHLYIHVWNAASDAVFTGVWDKPGHTFHYADKSGITRCVIRSNTLIEAHFATGGRSEWVRLDYKS